MIAIDTNILVYAEGIGDASRCETADVLIRAALGLDLVVPIQVLAETFRVLLKKGRLDLQDTSLRVARYANIAKLAPTLPSTWSSAVNLATEHRLQIFDAVILAASAESGCRVLLSEDMQDGFVWRGLTIVNPFATTPHPMLSAALRN